MGLRAALMSSLLKQASLAFLYFILGHSITGPIIQLHTHVPTYLFSNTMVE